MRGTRVQVWLVAVLTIGVWFVAAPRSASADCVTFYVSGSSDGAFVEGSATIWLDIEGCWAEEYSGIVDTDVVVDGPGGWSFDTQSGYAFATASTFLAVNGGYGTYGVFGDGYAHFIWWYFEHYEDSTSVFVPPPPPPPPPCVYLPIARKGMAPGNLYRYNFYGAGWTQGRQNALNSAFAQWEAANLPTTLNVTFAEESVIPSADLLLTHDLKWMLKLKD